LVGVDGHDIHVYADDVLVSGSWNTLQNAGVKWVRVGILWNSIERDGPTPDFTQSDTLINNDAIQHGFSILGTFNNVPVWAHCPPVGPSCTHNNNCPDADCMPTNCNPGTIEQLHNVAPANYCYFYKFVKAVLYHYGSQVAAYELWNEPNSDTYWSSGPNAYQSKILDPGIQGLTDQRQFFGISPAYIIAPGTLTDSSDNADVGTWVGGYVNKLDYLSIHAYRSVGDQITAQDNITTYANSHQIGYWVTEGGFATLGSCYPSCSSNPGRDLTSVQNKCVSDSFCFKDFIFYLHDPGCRNADCTGNNAPCMCCSGQGTGTCSPTDWGLVNNSNLVRDRLCYLENHYGAPLTVATPCVTQQDMCPRTNSQCANAP
jgi:hypothetical protein